MSLEFSGLFFSRFQGPSKRDGKLFSFNFFQYLSILFLVFTFCQRNSQSAVLNANSHRKQIIIIFKKPEWEKQKWKKRRKKNIVHCYMELELADLRPIFTALFVLTNFFLSFFLKMATKRHNLVFVTLLPVWLIRHPTTSKKKVYRDIYIYMLYRKEKIFHFGGIDSFRTTTITTFLFFVLFRFFSSFVYLSKYSLCIFVSFRSDLIIFFQIIIVVISLSLYQLLLLFFCWGCTWVGE